MLVFIGMSLFANDIIVEETHSYSSQTKQGDLGLLIILTPHYPSSTTAPSLWAPTGRVQPHKPPLNVEWFFACLHMRKYVHMRPKADRDVLFPRLQQSSQHLPLKGKHDIDHLQAAGDFFQDTVLLPQLV